MENDTLGWVGECSLQVINGTAAATVKISRASVL
jgi:hypothetical protein